MAPEKGDYFHCPRFAQGVVESYILFLFKTLNGSLDSVFREEIVIVVKGAVSRGFC